MKKISIISVSLLISLLAVSQTAFAGDIEWSGIYRAEGYHISNSELTSQTREKSYGLHHLILKPKIVAADGVIIHTRFDLFNNATTANHRNSQMGQYFGDGVGVAPPSVGQTNTDDSNTFSQNQKSDELLVSQLYLTLIQEFGSLIVGRAPVQFGLGVTHDAGTGMFDHWFDTRDMVGYKMVMGNLFFFPMYGKVNEGVIDSNDDVTDYLIQLQYENPETDTEMGIFYQNRTANAGNDTPFGINGGGSIGGTGATRTKSYDVQSINLYWKKDSTDLKFGFEAGLQNGTTGVVTTGGDNVSMEGFGAAAEFEYRPADSKHKYGINIGFASGDDPKTDDKFEGFVFDRNYDVAFLMFNHPLGVKDFLRTAAYGGGPNTATQRVDDADVEAISNVTYFSPYWAYQWKDRWVLGATLTAGLVNENPDTTTNVDKSLGYELDLSLKFMPNKNITWVNELGLLFPGTVFEGDGTLDAQFAYGLVTKAAISF